MNTINGDATQLTDREVTGSDRTDQIATKLEEEQLSLDKTKVEYDLAAYREWIVKTKSRDNRLYFQKMERTAQKCNKVTTNILSQSCVVRCWRLWLL